MVVFLLFKHLLWMMKLIQTDNQGELLHNLPVMSYSVSKELKYLETRGWANFEALREDTDN